MFNTHKLFGILLLVVLLIGVAQATTTTFTAAAGADGRVSRAPGNESFSAIRSGAGTAADTSTALISLCGPSVTSGTLTNNYSTMVRFGWSDDTSSIPDTDTVSAATFSIYGGSYKTYGLGNSTLTIVGFTPADPANLAIADYNTRLLVPLSANMSETTWSNSGWNNFTLNAAGLAYINKAGYTSLMLTTTQDIDNSTTGLTWADSSSAIVKGYQTSGASTDPILTTTHAAAGGGTPPASITGLTNDTPTCSSINWSWTNPVDADYNGTMIYNNNVFVHNGTAGSTQSWWGSLSELTNYTFSSRTFDNATPANVNITWVNLTAKTAACPDVTPPGSIQGLTNNTTVCESITWDWQGPGDADWNGTMIYKDSVLLYNVSNSTYSDTWAGLTGGVEYLFSSHTFDITGNVDPDWVNGTATPDACAIIPVADFIANDTEVCVDDPVMFNDTSTNTPTSWNWVMTPGGWDNHSESFVHAFDTAGSYNVSLEAGNAAGSDYENKTFYVNVTDCTLSADFEANLTCQIGKPMAVQFNGTCAYPTKSHWEFGEGNDSEEYSPNFTYTEYGVYTVTHSCKDAGGPTIFENKTDYIVVGVNGTVCAANCTGSGSYCSGDSDIEEPFNVMWLVFGLVGGLVILLFLSRR